MQILLSPHRESQLMGQIKAGAGVRAKCGLKGAQRKVS